MKHILALTFLFLAAIGNSQTIGTTILNEEMVQEGYTLFAPLNFNITYLINNCGEVVNSWTSNYPPGDEIFLDAEGNLWRAGRTSGEGLIGTGGRGGIIELFSWEGEVLWSYERCDTEECMHHDFRLLPNGNLLVLVWDAYSTEEAIAQGANPELLDEQGGVWSEYLVELEPDLSQDNAVTEVWSWHVWDHLIQDFDSEKPNYGVISDNPGKINLNYRQLETPDWLHCNGIDYNSELDQIIMSIPNMDEFWILDHDLTTEEAQSEAGDLMYRWGNPNAYDSGEIEDQTLFFNHNPHWIPEGLTNEGSILVFNNQNSNQSPTVSTVTVVTPAMDTDGNYILSEGKFQPETPAYELHLAEEFQSDKVSGAQYQPNGNLLVCSGTKGTFQEFTSDETLAWQYTVPVNDLSEIFAQGDDPAGHVKWVFRAYKYDPSFIGFEGKDLTPGNPIETNFVESFCFISGLNESGFLTSSLYPNPAEDIITLESSHIIEKVVITNSTGQTLIRKDLGSNSVINVSELTSGIYYIRAISDNQHVSTLVFTKL